jgi:hypothetical protein
LGSECVCIVQGFVINSLLPIPCPVSRVAAEARGKVSSKCAVRIQLICFLPHLLRTTTRCAIASERLGEGEQGMMVLKGFSVGHEKNTPAHGSACS